jgi:hypothetical protein
VVGLVVAALVIVTVPASQVWAQSARWGVALGGTFSGPASAGTTEAALIDPAGEELTLFRTSNRIKSGVGAEGVISRRLSERLRLEVAVGWASSRFESTISSDFENASGLTASLKAHQFTGELGLAYRVVQRGRFDVFVRAAGGGFREITEDRSLVENGWRASVGGGTLIRLRQSPSGFFGNLGLRADVRMQVRGAGIAFGDSARRVSPGVFAGLVIGQ